MYLNVFYGISSPPTTLQVMSNISINNPHKTIDLQGHIDNNVSQILYYEVTIRKLRYLGLKSSQVIELHPLQGIYLNTSLRNDIIR